MPTMPGASTTLFDLARECLYCADVDRKLQLTRRCYRQLMDGELDLTDAGEVDPIDVPGRPSKPELVSARKVPARSLSSTGGRAAFVHALAHIEFNAINLGWDAVYRFRGMPADYYRDWARVAAEEAQHFGLLREQLRAQGFDYGDFPAHNGLWEMAQKTADDVLRRMALVPRVLEARGLDVAPGMIDKFRALGDQAMVDVMSVILKEEVGHVEIGSRWFRYLCDHRGLDPETVYRDLFETYMKNQIKGPLNRPARLQAGFSAMELDYLDGLI
jgi:uncharacterized ferritin-like protein (DUF455 family)